MVRAYLFNPRESSTMYNLFILCMLATSFALVVSSAMLCYHNKSGWHWFLAAAVLTFFSVSSMAVSLELVKAMNIDLSNLPKPNALIEANK